MTHSPQKRKHAVMLIIERDGLYLFVKRAAHDTGGGFWCPVSGGIDDGETQEQAVVREAWEEVGLRVRPLEKIVALPNQAGDYVLHWWTTKVLSGQAHVKAPHEIDDVRWVAPADFDGLTPNFPDSMELIARLSRTHSPRKPTHRKNSPKK